MSIDIKKINYSRRKITSSILSIITLCCTPINVALSAWNKLAFNATEYKDSLLALGITDLNRKSNNITLNAPDIAENGAIVPIEVTSNIKDTDSIFIFVKDNPQPFTAKYKFSKIHCHLYQRELRCASQQTLWL